MQEKKVLLLHRMGNSISVRHSICLSLYRLEILLVECIYLINNCFDLNMLQYAGFVMHFNAVDAYG